MKVSYRVAILSGLACAFSLSPAAAQPNETEAVDATIACLDISDSTERLSCLEAAAETLKVTRIIREEAIVENKKKERENFGLAGADDDQEELRVAETPDDFGGENLPEKRKERDEKRLKKITAKIAEIKINPFGKVTLTLENGQVWRQLSSDNHVIKFSGGDRLYTAKVKRSILGNYMLTVNELKRTIRVKRIK